MLSNRALKHGCVGLVVVTLWLGGCSYPEDDPVMLQLNDIENRLEQVERIVDNDSLVELASVDQQVAEEIRLLRGEVETLQHLVNEARQQRRNLYNDLDRRVAAVELGGVAGGAAAAGAAVETPGASGVFLGGTEQESYQNALAFLQEGRYQEAVTVFRQFLAAYPSSSLAANAQYWLGESHYVLRNFERAIDEFSTVIDRYPSSTKIADAKLKIGYCQYELGRWQDARASLTSVVNDYPKTTAANLASKRLEQMRREGH